MFIKIKLQCFDNLLRSHHESIVCSTLYEGGQANASITNSIGSSIKFTTVITTITTISIDKVSYK